MPPRLLLLEDDPVSARFLRDALARLPADVEHAATLADAECLAGGAHDLWVFDARLPDGHAGDLLSRLRARGLATPAIALSADVDDAACRRLLAAGFAQVLAKPLAGAALRDEVRRLLESRRPAGVPAAPVPVGREAPPTWDDAAALVALGSTDAVEALRALFVAELPDQRRRVQAACRAGDADGARDVLHRLTSGCGFVGAAALLAAVRAVAADPGDAAALARFEACADALGG
jgi:DNA-binding response OmpR family regulator